MKIRACGKVTGGEEGRGREKGKGREERWREEEEGRGGRRGGEVEETNLILEHPLHSIEFCLIHPLIQLLIVVKCVYYRSLKDVWPVRIIDLAL